jgi:hypothetical protein
VLERERGKDRKSSSHDHREKREKEREKTEKEEALRKQREEQKKKEEEEQYKLRILQQMQQLETKQEDDEETIIRKRRERRKMILEKHQGETTPSTPPATAPFSSPNSPAPGAISMMMQASSSVSPSTPSTPVGNGSVIAANSGNGIVKSDDGRKDVTTPPLLEDNMFDDDVKNDIKTERDSQIIEPSERDKDESDIFAGDLDEGDDGLVGGQVPKMMPKFKSAADVSEEFSALF